MFCKFLWLTLFIAPPTEQLHQKDQQIITLLEEKEKIFRDMTDSSGNDDGSGTRVLFRANTEEAPKGESIMKSVLSEGKWAPD